MSDALTVVALAHAETQRLREAADTAQQVYVDAVRDALAEGHSVIECAKAAGLGRHAVYAALRRRSA